MNYKAHRLQSTWLNLILHTTAYINEKKQALLSDTVFQTFADILIIVLAETFLAIISLPLYITARETSAKKNGMTQYQMRRSMTLVVLIPLIIILVLKFAIIGVNYYNLSLSQSGIFEVSSPHAEITESDTANLMAMNTNNSITSPEITAVTSESAGDLTIRGTALPKQKVVVYLSYIPQGSVNESLRLYEIDTDNLGNWMLSQQTAPSIDSSGRYIVRAFIHSPRTQEKSKISSPIYFNIEPSFRHQLLHVVDQWLSVLMFAFIGLGTLLAFLTSNLRA